MKKGITADFENGEFIVRYYNKYSKKYITHSAPMMIPKKKYRTIKSTKEFQEDMAKLPDSNMELEFEFLNYLPIIKDNIDSDGILYYPLMRIIADRKSGVVINCNFIDKNNMII